MRMLTVNIWMSVNSGKNTLRGCWIRMDMKLWEKMNLTRWFYRNASNYIKNLLITGKYFYLLWSSTSLGHPPFPPNQKSPWTILRKLALNFSKSGPNVSKIISKHRKKPPYSRTHQLQNNAIVYFASSLLRSRKFLYKK